MLEAASATTQLVPLVELFYPELSALGTFLHCTSDECPLAYRAMLDHERHMTVTVESRHHGAVDVEVLAKLRDETHYMRKILLHRQSDRGVVLFGIVRLALDTLQPQVRDDILSQGIPLGRVLITHGVLRHVQLNALWRVGCGAELAEYFGVPTGSTTYGRTALIYCDGKPAVELLEIVSPEEISEGPNFQFP